MKEKLKISKTDFVSFELKFLAPLNIVSAGACALTVLLNVFVVELSVIMVILPTILGLAFLGIYYWAEQGKNILQLNMKSVFRLKLIYSVSSIFLLNMIWYFNNGSHGPSPFLFIILLSILVFIWQGRQLVVVLTLFSFNIITLFLIDYTYPTLIDNYKTDLDRIFDVYLGVFVFGAVIFALINYAKKDLMKQILEAKRSDMLKSAFLANMSHEIRTPMNAIFGFSQVLKDSDFTEEEKKPYIDLICNQTDYLLSIISELIDISKIESGVLTISDDATNLKEIISIMPNSLKHLKKEGVEIKLSLDESVDDTEIITDATRLKQVITNLTSNALKYTFNGYVELGYQFLDNGFIEIYVKDTGIGISPNNAGKIFDRFYQIESKNKTVLNEGTGLGLSIASALVKRMGGEIWVESAENEGSIFSFTIPYRPVNASKASRKMPETSQALDLKGCTVLVVDDQKSNYMFLKPALSAMNCKSIWSANGKDAVKLVKNNKNISLVIMDAEMPGMDGYAATRMIKQYHPNLPVIVQSLFTADDKRSKIKEAGGDDFITKPIRINQLKELLKKYLTEK
jgi:signal transduction histidine kinase/CheY-like chemotaxis protein